MSATSLEDLRGRTSEDEALATLGLLEVIPSGDWQEVPEHKKGPYYVDGFQTEVMGAERKFSVRVERLKDAAGVGTGDRVWVSPYRLRVSNPDDSAHFYMQPDFGTQAYSKIDGLYSRLEDDITITNAVRLSEQGGQLKRDFLAAIGSLRPVSQAGKTSQSR